MALTASILIHHSCTLLRYWAEADRDHSGRHWQGEGYRWRWEPRDRKPYAPANKQNTAGNGGGGPNGVPDPPAMEQKLVCAMPGDLAKAMVAFHQNCVFDGNQALKRDNM